MNLNQISLCNKSLDFKPRRAWPRLWPAYSWQGYLVSGFDKDDSETALEIEGSFLDALQSCYPELSLGEMARLWQKISHTADFESIQLNELFGLYGRPFRARSEESLLKLSQCPWAFQNWCDDKSLHIQDLAPLRSIDLNDDFRSRLTELAALYPSKSIGTETLELLVELQLKDGHCQTASSESMESWLQELRQKRYPMSFHEEQKKNKSLKDMRWPKNSQVRWTRRGDRSGIEVKVFVSSDAELEKTFDQVKDSLASRQGVWS